MFLNFNDLGEKTLNKIAEMALASQIKKADKLTVKVKTDPNLLAQGILESLAIDCQGMMVEGSLRLHQMKIMLNTIAVSPFKALTGNIKLTQASQGLAYIVLTEVDLTRAFNSRLLQGKLKLFPLINDGQLMTPEIQQINCQLLTTETIIVTTQLRLKESQDLQQVKIQITPKVCPSGNGVLIDDVEFIQGQEFASILKNTFLEETRQILNLYSFVIDGFSIIIKQLNFSQGQVTVQATATITHFPGSS